MEIIGAIYGEFVNIFPHWIKRNQKFLQNITINQVILNTPPSILYDASYVNLINKCIRDYGYNDYTWGVTDHIRLIEAIKIVEKGNIAIQLDIDTILFKPLQSIIALDYDFIISRAECGNKAWPHDCSIKVGFGACSGFYIAKKNALDFLKYLLNCMKTRCYNSFTDQETIMKIFSNDSVVWHNKVDIIDDISYKNKITTINNVSICVLDYDIFERGIYVGDNNQFGNHFPVKKGGGIAEFINILNYENNNDVIKQIYKTSQNDKQNTCGFSDEEKMCLINKYEIINSE